MAEQSATDKVSGWVTSVREYVGELQTEMRRVTWPTWAQVRATTTVVIVTVMLFAAFFFVVDFFISRGVTQLIQYLS